MTNKETLYTAYQVALEEVTALRDRIRANLPANKRSGQILGVLHKRSRINNILKG